MNTAETRKQSSESSAPPQMRSASGPGARFIPKGTLFIVTVAAFAAATFLAVALIFGLLFNAVTIHLTIFVCGLLAFFHGFTEYRNRLAARGTATATASSAAIGLVELSGRGYAEYPSEAAVTKRLCAYWKVEVEVRGKNDFRWLPALWSRVMERSSGCPETIEFEDGTGRLQHSSITPESSACVRS